MSQRTLSPLKHEEADTTAWHGGKRARANTTTSGVLLAIAAVPFGVVYGSIQELREAPLWLSAGTGAISLLFLFAGAIIMRHIGLGRILATSGIVGTLVLGAPHLSTSPPAALSALVAATATLVLLWKVGAPLIEFSRDRQRPMLEGQTQGAAMAALGLWLVSTFTPFDQILDGVVLSWGMGLSSALCLTWAAQNRSTHPARSKVLLSALAFSAALAFAWWGNWWWTLSGFVVPAVVGAAVARPAPHLEMEQDSWWEPLLGHPERLFVGTFAGLCGVGTLLLALPQSAASRQSVGFVDALFTSTSAVCVTGLIVLDTPNDLSGFGQLVILLLIQFGGLGIMTFSTAALWVLGRRMSLRHEGAVASLISTRDRGRLFATASRILQFTLTVEGVGALLLAVAFFVRGDSVATALWRGLFTSILRSVTRGLLCRATV